MAFIMCTVPDEIKSQIEQVKGNLSELGFDASQEEVLSYLLEEGLGVVGPDIEQNVRRQRFLNSFGAKKSG